jgi:hypothetical protein
MRLSSAAAGCALAHLAVMAALVFSVAGRLPTASAQPTDPNANVIKKAPPTSQRSSVWTQERILAAKLKPVPNVDPSTIKKGGPARAGRSATGSARDTGQGDARVSGDVGSVPLKWAGKLFYRQPDGGYVCSGQFITDNVVLTAAHCLRDDTTGDWFEDYSFRLQYDKGRATVAYGYDCAMTKHGWVVADGTRWNYDYGLIRVLGRSRTGHFGWHANWPTDAYPRVPKIGYPADILNGQVIQMDTGPLTPVDGEEELVALKHGNPRNAGGSSGGAWVGNFSRSANGPGNRVISVTSHHRGDDTTVSYGVRLGTGFMELLESISRGC